MSSMRNAVQRRNHKERAQPLERQKWGILEKHKDYSLRAKDHNEKKKRIKALRQKASERNPDEFAFGMMSSKTKNGVKLAERQKENGHGGVMAIDLVKLLKTQDAGYLQTILQQTRRERERTQQDAVLADTGVDTSRAGQKKTFDDGGVEVAEKKQIMGKGDDDDDDGDDFNFSDGEYESSEEDEEAEKGLTKEQIQLRRRKRHTSKVLQNRLAALTKREKDLSVALMALDKQRAKMNNTIGGVNKNGVKFKLRERKR